MERQKRGYVISTKVSSAGAERIAEFKFNQRAKSQFSLPVTNERKPICSKSSSLSEDLTDEAIKDAVSYATIVSSGCGNEPKECRVGGAAATQP